MKIQKMKKSVYSIITIVLILYLVTGCERLDDFGDTNQDPSNSRNPETSALLTKVLSGLAEYSNSDFTVQGAIYCQYFAETFYVWTGLYEPYETSLMRFYSDDLYDLQTIIIANKDIAAKEVALINGANENQIAISRILKAYIYWIITDCWGDVPYKDALKGDPNVSYDTQEYIYKNLLIELTDAVAQFTENDPPIKGDIVYDGDLLKWKKFANSLRMLMSLRLSKQYPLPTDYAALQFNAALQDSAGSIETNEDNFQLNYPGEYFRNFYYTNYDNSSGFFGESATMTSLMDSLNNDQRQTVFGSTSTGAPSTLGVPVGINYPATFQWCSENPGYCYVLNPDYRKQTSPNYVITAAHAFLARAEAADRGWTSETPNTAALYQEGITLSFLQWGLDAPDMTYFNSPNVALAEPPGTGANLKQIAIQQYVAFYPDGIQGWSNWRRTNYPILSPAPEAINIPPTIARRFMYGTEDYNLAKDSVAVAVARLPGGDKLESRVWWDKE